MASQRKELNEFNDNPFFHHVINIGILMWLGVQQKTSFIGTIAQASLILLWYAFVWNPHHFLTSVDSI